MRVISGSARGKKLMTPTSEAIRPTTDRIKESLFNIISPYIRDSVFIDIFSGSGAIGIEALSRGADLAYFIDKDPKSIKLIKKNLEITRLIEKGKVLNMEAEGAIKLLKDKSITADIIFMDPPYHLQIIPNLIKAISDSKLLSKDGLIIAEHEKNVVPEEHIGDYSIFDQRKYGITLMTYYRRRC